GCSRPARPRKASPPSWRSGGRTSPDGRATNPRVLTPVHVLAPAMTSPTPPSSLGCRRSSPAGEAMIPEPTSALELDTLTLTPAGDGIAVLTINRPDRLNTMTVP